VQALLLEVTLQISGVFRTKQNLLGAPDKHVARHGLSVLLPRKVEEGNLILEALCTERDIFKTLELFLETSGDNLAGHPVEGLISVLVEGKALVACGALALEQRLSQA